MTDAVNKLAAKEIVNLKIKVKEQQAEIERLQSGVKRGEWKYDRMNHWCVCSNCGWHDENKYSGEMSPLLYVLIKGIKFCPNCGTKNG